MTCANMLKNKLFPSIMSGMDTISLKDWARLRGVNHFTVRRWMQEGRVQPAPQYVDGAWRFSPDAVRVCLPTDRPHRD